MTYCPKAAPEMFMLPEVSPAPSANEAGSQEIVPYKLCWYPPICFHLDPVKSNSIYSPNGGLPPMSFRSCESLSSIFPVLCLTVIAQSAEPLNSTKMSPVLPPLIVSKSSAVPVSEMSNKYGRNLKVFIARWRLCPGIKKTRY